MDLEETLISLMQTLGFKSLFSGKAVSLPDKSKSLSGRKVLKQSGPLHNLEKLLFKQLLFIFVGQLLTQGPTYAIWAR